MFRKSESVSEHVNIQRESKLVSEHVNFFGNQEIFRKSKSFSEIAHFGKFVVVPGTNKIGENRVDGKLKKIRQICKL